MGSIKSVKLNQPVEFSAFHSEGVSSRPVLGADTFTMNSNQVEKFIKELEVNENLGLIENTLQDLFKRADGIYLKTAFPSLLQFKYAVKDMLSLPKELNDLIVNWEFLGADEIYIDFEAK